jgi:hypothetical protein
MTDESVIIIGRMLGGLISLTRLYLDTRFWSCLSDRSVESIFRSLSQSCTLEFVRFNLSIHPESSIT